MSFAICSHIHLWPFIVLQPSNQTVRMSVFDGFCGMSILMHTSIQKCAITSFTQQAKMSINCTQTAGQRLSSSNQWTQGFQWESVRSDKLIGLIHILSYIIINHQPLWTMLPNIILGLIQDKFVCIQPACRCCTQMYKNGRPFVHIPVYSQELVPRIRPIISKSVFYCATVGDCRSRLKGRAWWRGTIFCSDRKDEHPGIVYGCSAWSSRTAVAAEICIAVRSANWMLMHPGPRHVSALSVNHTG